VAPDQRAPPTGTCRVGYANRSSRQGTISPLQSDLENVPRTAARGTHGNVATPHPPHRVVAQHSFFAFGIVNNVSRS
jgi:hypothetical protein